MDTVMDTVDVSGVRVAYRSAGPVSAATTDGSAATTMLMTHGYAASSHMFAGNAAAIAQRHRVISWDVRGHGGSDAPIDQALYSVDLAVADMLAVLDHAGVRRAVLAGHSLGGYLSLRFHLAHPDRVQGLVLIDTGPGYRNVEARSGWNKMANGFATALDQRGFAGHAGGAEFDPSVHLHGPHGLALAARGILTQHDAAVIESLPAVAVPTLVIVGSEDEPFLAGSHYMANKIPNSHMVVIDGAGHAPNVSHPAEFDSAVASFLDLVAKQGDRDDA
jgi:pimeloyl-ACP methyl ester carboxylesterase